MVMLRGIRFKGDEVALEVLKNVNEKVPIHAVFVGNKSLVKHYSKTVGLNFEFSVFSIVPDEVLAELYSSSDVFLPTSYAESFGLPPLETMACGIPVAMTDNKGSRDYAIDGFNAIISQPGDVKSMSDNLLKVIQDDKLRERKMENGLETAKKFTWTKTVESFEKALKETNWVIKLCNKIVLISAFFFRLTVDIISALIFVELIFSLKYIFSTFS
jgi:Glycosyltransferase